MILTPLISGTVAILSTNRWARILSIVTVTALAVFLGLLLIESDSGAHSHNAGGWSAPLGILLYVDGMSLLMLVMTLVIGAAVMMYASGYSVATMHAAESAAEKEWFWALSLYLLAALNALFLSNDLFNLYVTLELLGLISVMLMIIGGARAARIAAMRYLLVALVGSVFYLLGVVLVYSRYGVVDMGLLRMQGVPDPATVMALSLMTAGLHLKTGLFPGHFWLPPAHANAPAPVSALLSALVVKAPYYILLRLWLWTFPGLLVSAFADLLAVLGVAAIFWGSVQAYRQPRLKLLIAYSTVAQLGYLLIFFAFLSHHDSLILAISGAVYLVISHACAKASLFLASGVIMSGYGHDRLAELQGAAWKYPMTFIAIGLAGMSLMGLPPSGGFIAKWLLLNSAWTCGRWGLVAVILISGLLTALYMFKVLNRALTMPAEKVAVKTMPRVMEIAPLMLALLAMMLGLVATAPLQLLDGAMPTSTPTKLMQPAGVLP